MSDVYKIMIVDDERIVRESIASQIAWETYGILVEKVAANAVEALEYLEKHTVDLMLVDIRMPVMDGIELLGRVRAAGRETACIILSGYADFSYAQEAMRFGARDYLLKPLEEAALVLVCRKLYVQDLDAASVCPAGEEALLPFYGKMGSWHRAYTGEIVEAYSARLS